jgi:hypothetical protein
MSDRWARLHKRGRELLGETILEQVATRLGERSPHPSVMARCDRQRADFVHRAKLKGYDVSDPAVVVWSWSVVRAALVIVEEFGPGILRDPEQFEDLLCRVVFPPRP